MKSKIFVILGGILFFVAVFGGTVLTLTKADPERELVSNDMSEE